MKKSRVSGRHHDLLLRLTKIDLEAFQRPSWQNIALKVLYIIRTIALFTLMGFSKVYPQGCDFRVSDC